MDALAFFKQVLPDEGIHFLVCFTKEINPKSGRPYTHHKRFLTLEDMAEGVSYWDNHEDYTAVYHACASYRTPYIETEKNGKPWKEYRTEDNWDRAQSFWVDIDCGQDKFDKGQGYLTKADGYKAIGGFCKMIGWPVPLVIDSGNGIHCYWPLTKPITAAKWRIVAQKLKDSLSHAGVLADKTRTADFASILRPIGSFNRKGDAKEVKARNSCEPSDPADLFAALQSYVKANDVKEVHETKKRDRYVSDLNSDLTAHLHYPEIDSSIDLVSTKCEQVAHMRRTLGDVGYETWRGIIGLAAHCVDGQEKMELWNEKRIESGHDQDDWKAKWDTWNAGPTSCEFLAQHDAEKCVGCEFKGKIKSPIVLGRIIPINAESTMEAVNDEGETAEVDVPAMLTGYTWSNGVLARLMPDKDGILQALPFCHTLFYLTSRIRTEDGTFRVGVRMHLPNKKVRDFEISTESLASNTDLLRAMSRYELTRSNHKDSGTHMAAYIHDQLHNLMRRVEEVNTLTTFGWKHDDTAFLLGDRLFHSDGSVRKVLVGGYAASYTAAFSPSKGGIGQYAEAINFLYNHEGAEYWQYALASGWGGPLSIFGEDLYKGLLVALSGGDTGKGKTTVCYAAMYAYGNADKMALKSKDGFTYNALWSFLGAFNNLPVLFDELTSMEGQMFSDLAYGVSLGVEKTRMTSKGGTTNFAKPSVWRTSPYVTGNRDFHGLLATNQANSQAEAVRLIQINIDRYPVIALDPSPEVEVELVQQAVDKMKLNAGAAGEAFISYVVQNKGKVQEEVRKVSTALAVQLPGAKFRFYRNHAACTLAAARIMRDLGVHEFDMQRLYDFCVKLLVELAETVNVTNTVTPEEAFYRMMASLAPRIIVTQEYRDKRDGRGAESPRNRISGEVAGRYVLGSQNHKDHAGHLMLIQKDVREWCMANRVDYSAMMAQVEKAGALLKKSEKLLVTRGTDYAPIQQRCIVVDMSRMDKEAVGPTLVANEGVLVDATANSDV